MRHTEFWARMDQELTPAYARVWASQHVLTALEGRTVDEALAAGVPPKRVWQVVSEVLEVPDSRR